MIDGLKPYPAMKDSGEAWLGKVPTHWDVRRLGQFGAFSKGNGGNKEDEVSAGIPCIRYGDLYTTHQYFILNSRSFVSSEVAKEYTPLRFGDVLFAASGETVDEIGKSAVNLLRSEACCGGDVILFRPKREVEPRYMGYATDCLPAAEQKATMGRGITVIHIYADQLKRLNLALPPLPEQTAIVRFLDHADRRIRRYVRAKEKLIGLLEEQKRAIIHEAVTGRINVRTGQPYSGYKPSGVVWLGEVPDHWEITSLGAASLSIQTGPFGSQLHASDYVSDGIPVINPSNIRNGLIYADDRISVSERLARKLSRHILRPGDIVLARRGELGRCALVSDAESGWLCGTGSLRLRPKSDIISPSYLLLFMNSRSVKDALHLSSIGATMDNLNSGMVSRLRVFRPSLSEQASIVNYVNKITTVIGDGITAAQREIELLREYRIRLIADVVTGKVDVREAAAAPPEELDDPDAEEAGRAGLEGRDEDLTGNSGRTKFPTAREEMIA